MNENVCAPLSAVPKDITRKYIWLIVYRSYMANKNNFQDTTFWFATQRYLYCLILLDFK